MKVWFSTTTLKYKEYKKYYLMLRQYILDKKFELTDDWISEHGDWLEQNPYATRSIRDVYRDVLKAIDEADISIIEFTIPNFSSSHQITYSITKRKPTLVMRLQRDNTFGDSYIEAIDSPYLTVVEYTTKNYRDIIDDFIASLGINANYGRYNIVLTKIQKHYLDWASKKYKKSKSELIRDLIDTEIKRDISYAD